MSLGCWATLDKPGFSNAIQHAWDNNVLIIAAARNEDTEIPNSSDEYPIAASFENVIAVSATDKHD